MNKYTGWKSHSHMKFESEQDSINLIIKYITFWITYENTNSHANKTLLGYNVLLKIL